MIRGASSPSSRQFGNDSFSRRLARTGLFRRISDPKPSKSLASFATQSKHPVRADMA